MGTVCAYGHTLSGPVNKSGLTLGTGDKNHENRSNGWGISEDDVLGLPRVREAKSRPALRDEGQSTPSISLSPSAPPHTQPHI